MIDARGVAAVVRFQGRRAFTGTRLLWWIVLSIFPAGLVLLIQLTTRAEQPSEGWLFLFYALIPCVTCVLGVFLWLTSTIQAEIDAKRWIYLAVRPAGLTSVLIGNYLVTMIWTAAAAVTALTLATALTDDPQVWQAWTAIASLVPLSTAAYGSLYLLIGVLFVKRAMLVAVIYTVLVEILLGIFPALVNRLTIQFRLRSLWFQWVDFGGQVPEFKDAMEIFGTAPASRHVLILIGFAVGLSAIAIWLVQRKEANFGADTDF